MKIIIFLEFDFCSPLEVIGLNVSLAFLKFDRKEMISYCWNKYNQHDSINCGDY